MKLIIHWLISTVTLLIIAYLLPGVVISSFLTAFAAALILGIVNVVIRPILLIITIPINILTLGIFTLVINALMLWLVNMLLPGFTIINFATAIWAGIIYWIVNWILSLIFAPTNQWTK